MVSTPVANGQSSSSGHGAEHWPNPGTPMTQQNSWWMDVYSPKICYFKKKKLMIGFDPWIKWWVLYIYVTWVEGRSPCYLNLLILLIPMLHLDEQKSRRSPSTIFKYVWHPVQCLMECHMFPHDFVQHSFTRTNKSANKPPVWTNIHTTPTRTLGNLGMVNSSYG